MLGRMVSAGLSIATVPIFVSKLGTEAYGLVGLFASLQIVFAFLDFGLSATVNRQIAQHVAKGVANVESKGLLRTLEMVYWPIGLIIGVSLFSASNWIAHDWVNLSKLSTQDVRLGVIILALAVTVQWPVSLYIGVLQGLQEQAVQNALSTTAASLRTLASLVVVIWVSPTITAFLLTQAAGNVIELIASHAIAWRKLGGYPKSLFYFDIRLVKTIWRFALSFNLVGVLGLLLSQADRLVISKTLPLEQLSYYLIASIGTGAMPLVSNAVATAMFPQFSGHAATGSSGLLARSYHRALQAIALLTAPAAWGGVLFSGDILKVWTRNDVIVSQASLPLSLLAIAGLLNAISNPAYTLLVSHGHTKIPLALNSLSVLIFIPLMVVLIPYFGIGAAAAIWLMQNTLFVLAYTFYASKIVLHETPFRHLTNDVLVYFTCSGVWIGFARLLTLQVHNPLLSLTCLCLAGTAYLITMLFAARPLHIFPTGLLVKPLADSI